MSHISKSKIRVIISQMPVLRHSFSSDTEPFDIDKSEVVKWLLSHPGLKQAAFDYFAEMGFMNFDKETKTWAGDSVRDPITPDEKSRIIASRQAGETVKKMSESEFHSLIKDIPGISDAGVRAGTIHSYLQTRGVNITYGSVLHMISVLSGTGKMVADERKFRIVKEDELTTI